MPSNARRAFDASAQDVERLLEIHQNLGGDAPGRRFRLEVLNKSAIVLITAIWEAYCEDITAEALDHLIHHVPDASSLPKELRKRIARDLKAHHNDIAIWDLAGDGWKTTLQGRLAALKEERNRKLNTPKSEQIDQLFLEGLGLAAVSHNWSWKGMRFDTAKKKLDEYVSLRGAIAHRGSAAASCKKAQVEDYFSHVQHLVAMTGGAVHTFVKNITGKDLW